MRSLLSWILTPIFLFFVAVTLLIWHPLIALSRFLGPKVQKNVVEIGNFILVTHLRILGGSLTTTWCDNAPAKGPVIIVSNHQSYYDIAIFIWVFRRYRATFVAKQSLGRGLPSISYVLRNCGSALIDRGNPRQSLPQISAMGKYIVDHQCAACIFPEGTRARDGQMKSFKPNGLLTLLKAAPGVPVLPVAISGAWKLMRYDMRPVPLATKITVTVLPPLDRNSFSDEEIVTRCEQTLRELLSKQEIPE